MKSLLLTAVIILNAGFAYCADPQCVRVMAMASEFIQCSPSGDGLSCRMSDSIMSQDFTMRSKMIHAVADADACITGGARYIEFKYMGDLVGKASPTSGITTLK